MFGRFAYERPATLDAALAVLRDGGGAARILAGGTDLLVELRQATTAPTLVVDLKRVTDLGSPIAVAAGELRIAATTPLADVIAYDPVRAAFPALVEAAATVGSIQIRHRATLVGNVCHASPAADTLPALLVHDADVEIASERGHRRVPVSDFVRGPRRTILASGEVVTAIVLPLPEIPVSGAFVRLTRRRGVDLATASCCCTIDRDGRTRYAFGAVAPRPFVCEGAPDLALAAPISDVRASADYRRAMLPILARRALAAATARRDA